MGRLLLPIIVLLGYSTTFSEIYFKSLIDAWSNIAVIKMVEAPSLNLEKARNGKAKILSSIKGIFLDTLYLHGLPSIMNNGSIGIIFFDHPKSNRSKTKDFYFITSSMIDTIRYANMPDKIVFPYRIVKSSFYRQVDKLCRVCPDSSKNNLEYSDWVVNFDTIQNVLHELIIDPPLPRTKYFLWFEGDLCPPREHDFRHFMDTNNSLSDADRIAIYDCKFEKGVSNKVAKFIIGRPNSIIKTSEDTEQWNYNKSFALIFKLPDRILIDFIKFNGL